MILPSDQQGFLIGQRLELNIEETKRVVEAVRELKGELSEIKNLLAAGNRQSRSGRRGGNAGGPTPTPTPRPAGSPRGPRGPSNGANPPLPPTAEPQPPTPRADQARGANGRFERLSPEEIARRDALRQEARDERENKARAAQNAELVRSLGSAISGSDRLDPVISTLNELGGFLKPLKSIGAATLNATRNVARRVGGIPAAIKGAFLSIVIALLGAYAALSGEDSKTGAAGKAAGKTWLDEARDKVKNAWGIKSGGADSPAAGSAKFSGEGALSAQFESGGNAGIINPDPANKSKNYGIYQFNTKTGGLKAVLDKFDPAIVGNLASLEPGSPEFDAAWRELARTKPVEFAAEQHRAAKEASLEPLLPSAKEAGFDVSNLGVRAALFSASQQHGKKGNLKIYKGAGDVSGLSAEDQLIRLYASRGAYTANLPRTSNWTQRDVNQAQARYAKELPAAIALSRQPAGPVKMPTANAPAQTTPVEAPATKIRTDKPQASAPVQPLTQNLSDRSLAQIATGGIGQSYRSNWS